MCIHVRKTDWPYPCGWLQARVGELLIWWFNPKLPNRQIKLLTKFSCHMVSFEHLHSTLLSGLLLQHLFHTSVCFTSCKCSDSLWLGSRVVQPKYWQIALYTSKRLLLKNIGTYSATFVVTTQTLETLNCCYSWNSYQAFIGLTPMYLLTTPTKYCALFFAMLSASQNVPK